MTECLAQSTVSSAAVDFSGSLDSIPAGISVGIYPLTLSIDDASWTEAGGLIATPDRRSITIYTGNQIVYFWNDAFVALPGAGESGFPIPANSNATFACTQAVKIYLRLATGGGSASIKAMEFY